MENLDECPACKSYSSGVYNSLNYEYSQCQYCGCPCELLVQWQSMQPILEKARNNKFEKDIIDRLEKLEQENAQLKTEINKMCDLLAFIDIDELFSPIIKVKEILEKNRKTI